ncbi:uncharacterized protein PHACADRAFT_266059 [Phanerochaete carnosa HHB-10118-sp]|uniref:Uncharacterized protein n=1 Tax=Phanerochaete carnosa (strain HHB-10118-sp) TaxID=650164 RepID=K5VCQ0_PHACS|nr:uncharacterized protein PHACADRAFT_266059 [Phanerochaete carnosa HHB-10118-sp]EKM48848.1 hypothetical protein PHACADRAFT_266059 [Phanerochaete carnosa HHB-10118-sp]
MRLLGAKLSWLANAAVRGAWRPVVCATRGGMIGPGVDVRSLDVYLDAAHAPHLAAARVDLGAEPRVLAVAAVVVPQVHVCVSGAELVVVLARVLAGRGGSDARDELRAEAAPTEHTVRAHERRGVPVHAQREQPAVEQRMVPRGR